jgi:hypothetical protein
MFHLDIAKIDLVLHMLQWLYTYVASVCFKCFSYSKCMLQVFYIDVVYVALLYIYVASVCYKCFSYFKCMLQVLYLDVAYVTMVIHIYYKRMF